jgi:ATP-dependent DNA helicase DinG
VLTDTVKEEIRTAYQALSKALGLSSRPGQRQMIADVAQTLSSQDGCAIGLIEAGTGTGKTLAYAVAAIPLAQALGKHLVLATATINLQQQLLDRDLPAMLQHSGLTFSMALAKGRRRYVCLLRLEQILQDGGSLPLWLPENELAATSSPGATLGVYQTMLQALAAGQWDGDRDRWPDTLEERTWLPATADRNQCSGRRCPHVGRCAFFRAREGLQEATVIVANHDLVLADLSLGGGAILPPPEECLYVFDEGHHLPQKALHHFASFCRIGTTVQWLDDSQRLLAQFVAAVGDDAAALFGISALPGMMQRLQGSLHFVSEMVEPLCADALTSAEWTRGQAVQRFSGGELPEELRATAVGLAAASGELLALLEKFLEQLESSLSGDAPLIARDDAERFFPVFGAMLGRAEGLLALWDDFADGKATEPPQARWIELRSTDAGIDYALHSSPITAAGLLATHLWPRAAGAIVTSATLTALGSFDRFARFAGVPGEALRRVVPSPFVHAQACLRIPAMKADAGDAAAHTAELISLLPELLSRGGGTLVLFSSRRQLQDVLLGMPEAIRTRILAQGDAANAELLVRHCAAIDAGERSILFGLASFAEGVDLPGRYCDHVIIAKIPFAVPDSPLEAAMAEWITARGGNPFMEMSVPDAALRLVQACGRLLRSESDHGDITILDRRLVQRRYGRAILDSLPPFSRQID